MDFTYRRINEGPLYIICTILVGTLQTSDRATQDVILFFIYPKVSKVVITAAMCNPCRQLKMESNSKTLIRSFHENKLTTNNESWGEKKNKNSRVH